MKRSLMIYLIVILALCLYVPAFAEESGMIYAGAGDLDFSSLVESTEESTEDQESEKPPIRSARKIWRSTRPS